MRKSTQTDKAEVVTSGSDKGKGKNKMIICTSALLIIIISSAILLRRYRKNDDKER